MNTKVKELIKSANSYGHTPSLFPRDAYEILKNDKLAVLVDVRTKAELDWIGKPDINQEQYKHIEWLFYPGSAQNPNFLTVLNSLPKDIPLLFLCRSGIRSKMAVEVALENNFNIAIDILGGLEGQRNAQGHRRTIDGWCYEGLPWIGA